MLDVHDISTASLVALAVAVADAIHKSPPSAAPMLLAMLVSLKDEAARREEVKAGRPGPVPVVFELPDMTEEERVSGVAAVLSLVEAVGVAQLVTGDDVTASELFKVLLRHLRAYKAHDKGELH